MIESAGFPVLRAGLASGWEPNGNGADIPSSSSKRVVERYMTVSLARSSSIGRDSLERLIGLTLPPHPPIDGQPAPNYHVNIACQSSSWGAAMLKASLLGVAVALVCLPQHPGHAHHSISAEYDMHTKDTIEGVVSEVWFKNPHVRYYCRTRNCCSVRPKL